MQWVDIILIFMDLQEILSKELLSYDPGVSEGGRMEGSAGCGTTLHYYLPPPPLLGSHLRP